MKKENYGFKNLDCVDANLADASQRSECVKHLYIDTVDQKPRWKNFGEGRSVYGEKWEIGVEVTDKELDEDPDAWAPMMNYIYPLPRFNDTKEFRGFDDKKIKKALDMAGNLTLIRDLEAPTEDEYGLALTGGGMDFSWEIVKAHALLGYTPPMHFCQRLPRMAGVGKSPLDKLAIEACMRSAEASKGWAEAAIVHLKGFE